MSRTHALAITMFTVLWTLLWGEVTPLIVAGGFLIAILVVLVFPFPTLDLSPSIRPLHVIVLFVVFLWDMAVASFQVGWLAIRPKPLPPAALIEVPLITRSELLQVMTAELICLVPGSILIELDSKGQRMWLHVINVESQDSLAAARKMAHDQELRVLAAFGDRTEYELASARRKATA